MVDRYKAYPEYIESGVKWFGDIPSKWSMWKLAHAFNAIGSGTTPPTNNEHWFKGDVPWITTGELRERVILNTQKKLASHTLKTFPTLKKYPIGSVAIAMYGATIGRLGIFGVEATTNQACCVMTSSKQFNNKYLFYWLWAFKNDIIKLSSGGGQPNINQEKIASLKVSAPTIKEQQNIANFLDHETAKIDRLIAHQEKLIELLKEKRQVVISHAVTKGLDPQAPMKDSGVEWFGEVPEHWSVAKLKWKAQTTSGGTPPTSKYRLYYDGGDIPWIRTTDLNNNKLFVTPVRITSQAVSDTACSVLPKDSVLLAMYGGAGSIGKHALLMFESTINQAVCGIYPSSTFLPEFIHYFYEFYRPFWMVNAVGTRKDLNIGQDQIKEGKIPVPSLKEQKQIVDALSETIRRLDTLNERSIEAIALAKERKTALISAAVTGKIDVRDFPTIDRGGEIINEQ